MVVKKAKKFLILKEISILCLLICSVGVAAQQQNQTQDTMQNTKKQNGNQTKPWTNLDGFADTLWGTRYADVKKKLRILNTNQDVRDPVEIIYDSLGKEILIRRAGIFYRYLFYRKKNPQEEPKENIINRRERSQQEDELNNNARFFFVESSFPMVPTDMLLNKLNLRYGKYTNSGADKTQGFYLWDIQNGYLIQWVESYEGRPYSRNIYYISKDIRKEIMTDLKDYQQYKELKALDKIIP